MFKKFSFWVIVVLIMSIGSVVFIHWKSLQELGTRTSRVEPLYQRQKVIDSLSLSLERYRRMSTSFRKFSPEEVAEVKEKLRGSFSKGVARLDQLDPTTEERTQEHKLNDQLGELLSLSAHYEPTLFVKDAYIKPEVQAIHDEILKTLESLEKSTDTRISSLHLASTRTDSNSVVFLLGVGVILFALVLCILLRNHLIYIKPLQKLHQYANDLKQGKPVPQNPPHFAGVYGEVQAVLNQLALSVETHMRDRHKFILDIVNDLKTPLVLLQEGKYLIGNAKGELNAEQQYNAAESVRRGLAIFSGSLDDLNDIVDINRLEARLEEKTVDLSELITDSARTLLGSEMAKRVSFSVPPIPVWVSIDARRFERVLVQVLSKVIQTLPPAGNLCISVAQSIQGSFRGVEILIQDSERLKSGRTMGGPEQDILKHWVSESGLSMALASKVLRAHGGSIVAAGVAGMSVSVILRLPPERVVSHGLISRPSEETSGDMAGLLVQRPHGALAAAVPK